MPAGRPFASVTISFGLIAIPVQVWSAEIAAARLGFNLLHEKDGSRVKQQYVCALDGEIVTRDEMVKGYEFEKGRYVRFKPEEIKALEEAGSDTIAIEQFVPLASVDPLYFDRGYLLSPDRHGAKPYALLSAVLTEGGRCAVGRWANHGRDHVVVLRATGVGLALHQLHFQDEVRTLKDIALPDLPEISANEMKLAKLLVDELAVKRFDPLQYRDEFRERVQEAIDRKVRSGKEITGVKPPERGARPESNVVDLMDVLKRSLARGGADAAKLPARKPPRRVTASAPKPKRARRS